MTGAIGTALGMPPAAQTALQTSELGLMLFHGKLDMHERQLGEKWKDKSYSTRLV